MPVCTVMFFCTPNYYGRRVHHGDIVQKHVLVRQSCSHYYQTAERTSYVTTGNSLLSPGPNLRRPQRHRLGEPADPGDVEDLSSHGVGCCRAPQRLHGQEPGAPGQELREADPEQVHCHVPPWLEHVPLPPTHVPHRRLCESGDRLRRCRPKDRLR